jgi:hypothetical protein
LILSERVRSALCDDLRDMVRGLERMGLWVRVGDQVGRVKVEDLALEAAATEGGQDQASQGHHRQVARGPRKAQASARPKAKRLAHKKSLSPAGQGECEERGARSEEDDGEGAIRLPKLDLSRSRLLMLTRIARLKMAREKADGNGQAGGAGSRNKTEHGRLLTLYGAYVAGCEGHSEPLSFEAWVRKHGSEVRCPKCGKVNHGKYQVCPSCVDAARREDRAFEVSLESGGDWETDL